MRRSPAAGASYYVNEYYPRNILHETIHVLQYSHGWRKLGKWAALRSPSFYVEGDAESVRFTAGLSVEELWKSIAPPASGNVSDPRRMTPFNYTYALGALLWRYLNQAFGDGVHQAFLDGLYDGSRPQDDLVRRATGLPEPLVLAMMWAALVLDGTALGSDTGLEFPNDDLRQLQIRPRLVPLALGGSSDDSRQYSGAVFYELSHDGPVRFTLESGPEAAYVIVAQPADR